MRVVSLFLVAVLISVCAFAFADNRKQSVSNRSLVLVELFTSQSCSSCPPAEAYFSELADREELVVIQWHVDYWNDLIHRGSSWEDPYSRQEFTERQVRYNKAIRGSTRVYTPQAIVQGKVHLVGSRRQEIEAAITDAEPDAFELVVFRSEDRLNVRLDGEGQGRLIRVDLTDAADSRVMGGENEGRVLGGRNIATGVETLAYWSGGTLELTLSEPAIGQACAILLQSGDETELGPVHVAEYCPA